MVEKVGLFPETTHPTCSATTSHKYMSLDTQSSLPSFEMPPAFRGFPSDQCLYPGSQYHTSSIQSEKLFHRDSNSNPYPSVTPTTESSVLSQGVFQTPHAHHSHHHQQQQQQQQTYGDPNADSKVNINVNIYQSQQHTQEAGMMRRTDSRQSSRYQAAYGYNPSSFYGSPVLPGSDRQSMMMDTGYSQLMGRAGSMFTSELSMSASARYGRRPSLTIPMPPHNPDG